MPRGDESVEVELRWGSNSQWRDIISNQSRIASQMAEKRPQNPRRLFDPHNPYDTPGLDAPHISKHR